MDRERSGVERTFRSVVAPMHAAKSEWNHLVSPHLHSPGPSKTLSHANFSLFLAGGTLLGAEPEHVQRVCSCMSSLRDVPNPYILVLQCQSAGEEQEITIHAFHRVVIFCRSCICFCIARVDGRRRLFSRRDEYTTIALHRESTFTVCASTKVETMTGAGGGQNR